MSRPDPHREEPPPFSSIARDPGQGSLSMIEETPLERESIMGVSRATALVIGITLVHLVLAWIVRTPGFGWGEDDAAFYLLARDLQSFQYRDIQDVLAPVHARFPPVFPAMLAIVGALADNNLDVLLAFVGLCSAASLVFFYDAARRTVGADVAVLMSALYALNHSALNDAGILMSEAPFKMFIALALWGAVRSTERTRYAAVAIAAVVLATLTRSAGVVLIPALAGYWLLKRRYAYVFGLGAGSSLIVAWFWFTFNAPDADDRRLYVADLKGADETVSSELWRRLEHFPSNVHGYLTDLIPWTISTPTIPGTIVDNAFWLGVTLVFGTIGMIALFRQWRFAAIFLVLYGGLVVIWRYTFERLVRPAVPLIFAVLLTGCAMVLQRMAPRYRFRALLALSALLAIGALQKTVPEIASKLACDRSAPADSETCWPGPERELLTLSNWVRDSTPVDAIFLVSKERAFYVHSGRKSINQDRALDEDSTTIGDYLRSRGVTYTVLSTIGVHARRHNQMLLQACREFEVVRQFTTTAALFRVLPANSPGDSSACRAMQAYVSAVARTS
jgi:hypothetical protein